MPVISGAVEGVSDEAVLRRLIASVGADVHRVQFNEGRRICGVAFPVTTLPRLEIRGSSWSILIRTLLAPLPWLLTGCRCRANTCAFGLSFERSNPGFSPTWSDSRGSSRFPGQPSPIDPTNSWIPRLRFSRPCVDRDDKRFESTCCHEKVRVARLDRHIHRA